MKQKVIIQLSPKRWDFHCQGMSPIMLYYYENKAKTDFPAYFSSHLNPDIAPIGFLEELDRLLTISRERTVVIKCDNNGGNKFCPCATIKAYIELSSR